ncbi:hypothetical protein [Actinomadura fibrosa]|uniref:Uncharacterized protein n=1 Tax=Actinomadura fibrosa TaxID=111802 RepID=A0ABW2XIP7_9ACTN|nr:hypothetical protein [Actinomadura fibrosa]
MNERNHHPAAPPATTREHVAGTALSPSERPARPGETCTCGRMATTVFLTERFGEVGYCGQQHPRAAEPYGADENEPCKECGTMEFLYLDQVNDAKRLACSLPHSTPGGGTTKDARRPMTPDERALTAAETATLLRRIAKRIEREHGKTAGRTMWRALDAVFSQSTTDDEAAELLGLVGHARWDEAARRMDELKV